MIDIFKELLTTKVGYKKLSTNVTGYILACIGGFLLVSYYKSLTPPITVERTYANMQVVKKGSAMSVCRDIRYHRNSTSIIMRSFIKSTEPDKGDVVAGLTSIINRDAKLYRVCREEPLSGLVGEGEWFVETRVQYEGEYGLWTHTIKLEDIPIKVVK